MPKCSLRTAVGNCNVWTAVVVVVVVEVEVEVEVEIEVEVVVVLVVVVVVGAPLGTTVLFKIHHR